MATVSALKTSLTRMDSESTWHSQQMPSWTKSCPCWGMSKVNLTIASRRKSCEIVVQNASIWPFYRLHKKSRWTIWCVTESTVLVWGSFDWLFEYAQRRGSLKATEGEISSAAHSDAKQLRKTAAVVDVCTIKETWIKTQPKGNAKNYAVHDPCQVTIEWLSSYWRRAV